MSTTARETLLEPAVLAYARLLHENHLLIQQGKGDDPEMDELADRMDVPWYRMTARECERMGGLSADLYSLDEDEQITKAASPDEVAAWQQAAREACLATTEEALDDALVLLRQSVPVGVPRHFVRFLQARCWEKLGDLNTALTFLRAAQSEEPRYGFAVVALLRQLGRREEADQQEQRLLDSLLAA